MIQIPLARFTQKYYILVIGSLFYGCNEKLYVSELQKVLVMNTEHKYVCLDLWNNRILSRASFLDACIKCEM